MAEELAYARKASGLVRGLSVGDAFAMGIMNTGVTPALYTAISLGLGIYMGGNLIIATLIGLALAGVGFPIMWGMLGGSMPRSGGEYIYNSRIIHPIVGMMEGFGSAFIMIMWLYVLAPWVADPGVAMLAQYMGWTGVSDFVTSSWGQFAIGTCATLFGFVTITFGIKVFASIQKVMFGIGMLGLLVIGVSLTITSRGAFEHNWNVLAEKYGSVRFAEFVPAVSASLGSTVPTTWNWVETFGLMGAGSWLFLYTYFICFVGGEVKKPSKSILAANAAAIVTIAVTMLWVVGAMYRVLPFNFVSAAASTDLNGAVDGYTFPFSPSYMSLSYIAHPNWFVAVAISVSFVAFGLWWMTLSYLGFARIIFAFSMDRMGPKWFTDINPRFASPVKNYVLCLVLSIIVIGMYTLWIGDKMQGLTVTAVELTSIFGVTAISATIFPFSKRARGIWDSSPYRTAKFLGVPVITLGGLISLVYIGIAFYFLVLDPKMADWSVQSIITFSIIWAIGLIWYLVFRRRNSKQGISADMTYGSLPPD